MPISNTLDAHFRRARELARYVVLVSTGSNPQTCALGGEYAAYDAAVEPALAAYDAALMSAQAAYDAALMSAQAAYDAAVAPARAAYDAAVAPAQAAYDAANEAEKRAKARMQAFRLFASFVPEMHHPGTWIGTLQAAEQTNHYAIAQYMNHLEYGCGLSDKAPTALS